MENWAKTLEYFERINEEFKIREKESFKIGKAENTSL